MFKKSFKFSKLIGLLASVLFLTIAFGSSFEQKDFLGSENTTYESSETQYSKFDDDLKIDHKFTVIPDASSFKSKHYIEAKVGEVLEITGTEHHGIHGIYGWETWFYGIRTPEWVGEDLYVNAVTVPGGSSTLQATTAYEWTVKFTHQGIFEATQFASTPGPYNSDQTFGADIIITVTEDRIPGKVTYAFLDAYHLSTSRYINAMVGDVFDTKSVRYYNGVIPFNNIPGISFKKTHSSTFNGCYNEVGIPYGTFTTPGEYRFTKGVINVFDGTLNKYELTKGGEIIVTVEATINKYKSVLKYDLNGGNGTIEDDIGTEIESWTSPEDRTTHVTYETPTRTGYDFLGWSTIQNGEVEYSHGDNITVPYSTDDNDKIVLYAVWTQTLKTYYSKLRFIGLGGSNIPDDMESSVEAYVVPDDPVTFTIPSNVPEKFSNNFLGWVESDAPDAIMHLPGEQINVPYTSDQTIYKYLYAKWQERIRFDSDEFQVGEPNVFDYDGLEHSVNVEAPSSVGDNWEFDPNYTSVTSATEPGTYYIYIIPSHDYAWSDGSCGTMTLTWTINAPIIPDDPEPEEPEPTKLPIPSIKGKSSFEYTGQTIDWLARLRDYNSSFMDYCFKNSSEQIVSNPTDIGTYKIYFSLNKENYVWSDSTTETKFVTFTIFAKRIEMPYLNYSYYSYDGSIKQPTLLGINGNEDEMTITNPGRTDANLSGENYSTQVSLKRFPNVVWKDNETQKTLNLKWSIGKKNFNIPTFTASNNSIEYDLQNPNEPVDVETILNGYDKNVMEILPHEDIIEPKKYQITIRIKNQCKSNYEWSDGTTRDVNLELNVTKVKFNKLSLENATYVYDGDIVRPNVVGFDSRYMRYVTKSTGQGVGEYGLEIELIDKVHTCWADNTSGNFVTSFNVNTRVIPTVSIENTLFQFTGKSIKAVLSSYDSKYVKVKGDLSAKDVGTYKITISLLDKNNTEWSDGTVEDIYITWVITDKSALSNTASSNALIGGIIGGVCGLAAIFLIIFLIAFIRKKRRSPNEQQIY